MTKKSKKVNYDLEERTAKFSENVIELCKKVPKNDITSPIIRQLIKAATSVGTNYCEAKKLNLIFNSIYIIEKFSNSIIGNYLEISN